MLAQVEGQLAALATESSDEEADGCKALGRVTVEEEAKQVDADDEKKTVNRLSDQEIAARRATRFPKRSDAGQISLQSVGFSISQQPAAQEGKSMQKAKSTQLRGKQQGGGAKTSVRGNARATNKAPTTRTSRSRGKQQGGAGSAQSTKAAQRKAAAAAAVPVLQRKTSALKEAYLKGMGGVDEEDGYDVPTSPKWASESKCVPVTLQGRAPRTTSMMKVGGGAKSHVNSASHSNASIAAWALSDENAVTTSLKVNAAPSSQAASEKRKSHGLQHTTATGLAHESVSRSNVEVTNQLEDSNDADLDRCVMQQIANGEALGIIKKTNDDLPTRRRQAQSGTLVSSTASRRSKGVSGVPASSVKPAKPLNRSKSGAPTSQAACQGSEDSTAQRMFYLGKKNTWPSR